MFKLKNILERLKIRTNKGSVDYFDGLGIEREKRNQKEPSDCVKISTKKHTKNIFEPLKTLDLGVYS